MRVVYFLGMAFGGSAVLTLLFTEHRTALLFILAVEVVLVFAAAELLLQGLPARLQEARSDNCHRIDGSFSERRLRHELRALNQVRMDLLAVLILVVLSANWLAYFVHSEFVSLPVAMQAASAFDLDSEGWKQKLRDARVDVAFEEWTARQAPGSHEQLAARKKLVWQAWPAVVVALAMWLVCSAVFVRFAFLKILREYSAGLATRSALNLNRDIAALQASANADA